MLVFFFLNIKYTPADVQTERLFLSVNSKDELELLVTKNTYLELSFLYILGV